MTRRAVRASSASAASPAVAGLLWFRRAPAPQTARSATAAPTINGGVWPSRTIPDSTNSPGGHWESGVAEPGQVNLRTLPELVVVEVLIGLQTRLRDGLRLTDVVLRAVCDTLRRHQVVSIHDCDPSWRRAGGRPRSWPSFARDARRMLADPGVEQAKDTWDLAIFGHPGRLSFTAITQPWLSDAAKRWAAEQLPHHRGSGASRVRGKINNLGLLSEHLARRPDHGLDPIRPWAHRPGRVPQPARPPGSSPAGSAATNAT